MAAITIRRQVVSVDLRGTEADGLALQHRLPAVCAEVIAPALESALSRFNTGSTTLVIDRLEIDVPAITLDRLTDALGAGVRQGVEECLLRAPPLVTPGASGDDAERVAIEERAVAGTVDGALAAFLTSGRLPWWFRLPPGQTLEQEVTQAWAGGGPAPGVRSRLSRVLAAPDARLRLRLQFGPDFVLGVVRAVAPPLASGVDEVLHALDEGDGRRPSAEARRGLTGRLLAAALAEDPGGHRPTASELVRRALLPQPGMPAPPSRGDPIVTFLERRWPGVTGGAVPTDESGPARPAGRPAVRSGSASDVAPEASSTPSMGSRESTACERSGHTAADGASARRGAPGGIDGTSARSETGRIGVGVAPSAVEDVSEGILVANAGVVLLHPFLPQLFGKLGLAAGDDLLDPPRAIALLHHLATGERTTPEHEVTLAKVLCGRPLDEPVPADVQLTKAETGEATTLLRAVIGHWTALRNTSPDVLRLEFLRRPGILSSADFDEWLLRVDTDTADILLGRLPWGASMIRLPWMPRMLHVEWR